MNDFLQLVKQCPDEELMEVVLPRLAKVITLWEFLLMKVEKGRPLRPRVDNMYREFEALHKQVQKLCQTYLSPLKPEDKNNEEIAKLNVSIAVITDQVSDMFVSLEFHITGKAIMWNRPQLRINVNTSFTEKRFCLARGCVLVKK